MAGGVFSTAKLNAMTIRESATDGSDFTNPDADYRRFFLGEDGNLHLKDSAGAVTGIVGVGVGVPYQVDYVEFTANVSITGTTEGAANAVVSAGAVAFDGSTPAIIEFYAYALQPDNTAANRALRVGLFDGATGIGILALVATQVAGVNFLVPAYARRRLTPSNASHTYNIKAWVSAGTGTVGAGAGGANVVMPGFIRVSKLTV